MVKRYYLDEDCYIETVFRRKVDKKTGQEFEEPGYVLKDSKYRGKSKSGTTTIGEIEGTILKVLLDKHDYIGENKFLGRNEYSISKNALLDKCEIDSRRCNTAKSRLNKKHPIFEETVRFEGGYYDILVKRIEVCENDTDLPEKTRIDIPLRDDINKAVSLKSTPLILRLFIEDSRDDIFEAMDKAFASEYKKGSDSPNVVILHGRAGCGKTELVKYYADGKIVQNADDFKTVVYAPFSKEKKIENNFETLIINDNLFNLSGISRNKNESDRHYFKRKLSVIQKKEGKETLIILDNFDDTNDRDVEKLLKNEYGPFQFSLLIISRNNLNEYPYDNFEHVFVDTMKMEYLVELFRENVSHKYVYYDSVYEEENKKIIEKIISLVGKHTLATEILRKNLAVSYCSVEEYYAKLKSADGLIFNEMEGKLRAGDYSSREPFEIIKRLFKISDVENITTKQRLKQVLTFFYAIPVEGIEKEIILPFIKNYGAIINHLTERGWIDETKGIMSMHPLVREVVYDYCKTTENNGKSVLKIDNCSDIINEIMNADGDYESALYHKPWEYKQKISQLYLSLINIFPYSENKSDDFFWFYNRLRLNLGFCNRWEMQANIFSEMLSSETDKWKKAYLTYRTEQFPVTYERSAGYIERILEAAKAMDNNSFPDSVKEKLELANLYRYVGIEYCNKIESMNVTDLELENQIIDNFGIKNYILPDETVSLARKLYNTDKIEEVFKKGEDIVKELLDKENPSKNALLYSGTISVWRAQLYAGMWRFGDAENELRKAEKIFAEQSDINKVDAAAILNVKALIYHRLKKYKDEAEFRKKTIEIFEKYFGVYNRQNAKRCFRLYTAYIDADDWDNAFYTLKKTYEISRETDYGRLEIIENVLYGFASRECKASTPEIKEEYLRFLEKVSAEGQKERRFIAY